MIKNSFLEKHEFSSCVIEAKIYKNTCSYEIIFNIEEPVFNAEVGCYLDLDCADNNHNVFCVYQKPVISQSQALEEVLSTKFDTALDVVCPENSDVYLTKKSYLNIITAIQSDKSSNARTGNCIICRENDESFLHCQEKIPESESHGKSASNLQNEQVFEVIGNSSENVNTKSEDVGDKNMEEATQQSFQSGSENFSNIVEHPVLDQDTLETLEDIPYTTTDKNLDNVMIDQEKSIKLTASQEMMPETILYEKEEQDDNDKHNTQAVQNFPEPANQQRVADSDEKSTPENDEIIELNVANPDELTEIGEYEYENPSFEVIDQHPAPVSDNHVETLATKVTSDDTITDDNSSNTPVLSIERDESLELIDKTVNNIIPVQSDKMSEFVQNFAALKGEEDEGENVEAVAFHQSIQEKLNKVHKALKAKARQESKIKGERINEKLQEGIEKLNKTIEGTVENFTEPKNSENFYSTTEIPATTANEVLATPPSPATTLTTTTSIQNHEIPEADEKSLVTNLSEKISQVL